MFCNLKWNCPETVREMGLGNGVHPMQARSFQNARLEQHCGRADGSVAVGVRESVWDVNVLGVCTVGECVPV